MRRLLWVGDAVAATGFARSTHHTLDVLRETWEVHVLGLNYNGDPHDYPYHIYPCWPGGDAFGIGRVRNVISALSPDVIVIQNDPWNVPAYLKKITNVPVIASMPVDGKNCRGADLNGLALAVFWTRFGESEARLGGYTGPSAVVPLGVDLDVYKPRDRRVARERLKLPESMLDSFIVGNLNRNQPRKRLDLTIRYFAEWVHEHHVDDANLFLHVAPTGDMGYDVIQLMRYYGLKKRLILSQPDIGHGAVEDMLVDTYGCFDVQVSTTQGEGWGLTTLEGMACGVPQIFPDWAALGDWASPAGLGVPCYETAVTPNNVNVVGGIPDRAAFIANLDLVYRDHVIRNELRERGLRLAAEPRYRWRAIGEAFRDVVAQALERRPVEVSA